jgi:hypothetical protein
MANEHIKELLDEFHYHEILDRLHMILSISEDHLLQHPVCKVERNVKQNIEKALEHLAEAYQIAGNISHKRFKDE